MVSLFGDTLARPDLETRIPHFGQVAGIRHLIFDDGHARGMRLLQVHSGGGLVIDLLPDRCCDIGQVSCNGIPFAWMGPNMITPPSLTRNMDSALSGLMTTCGFDHVRQPESDGGRDYPLHGSMALTPATIHHAAPVWIGDTCTLRVESEVTHFALNRGGMRLRRRIEVPLGGTSLRLEDEVTVIAADAPVMALYHFNLGYPLIAPDSECYIGTATNKPCPVDRQGIELYPLSAEPVRVNLGRNIAGRSVSFGVRFDGETIPYLQTYRRLEHSINLFCIEPVTHDRLPRGELRKRSALLETTAGNSQRFVLELDFNVGSVA